MKYKNLVFIARSLDGFIADKEGGLEWLNTIPNPENQDLGYEAFIKRIDAIVMGRITFETVCSFDIEWPYNKPVFVLSNSLTEVPEKYQDRVFILSGSILEILDQIRDKGYYNLYIDGGTTIQRFLKEDMIDEMIITTIPVLLGGGSSLFGTLPGQLEFEHVKSEVFLNAIVQDTYRRESGIGNRES